MSYLRIHDIMNSIDNYFLSHYDVLTKVKNRNSFENEYMNSDKIKHKNCFFIYIDVNGLHEINNTQGHEQGDILLKTIANGLIQYFGTHSSYRVGGDEFVCYTDKMDKAQIDKIISILEQEYKKCGYHASFGVAGANENYDSMKELIKSAEKRMYIEKKSIMRV